MTKAQQNSALSIDIIGQNSELLERGKFHPDEILHTFNVPERLLKTEQKTEAAALAEHEQMLSDGIDKLTTASKQALAIPGLDFEFSFNKAANEFVYIARYKGVCVIAACIDLSVQQATVELGLLCLRVHSLLVALDHTKPASQAA